MIPVGECCRLATVKQRCREPESDETRLSAGSLRMSRRGTQELDRVLWGIQTEERKGGGETKGLLLSTT